jgi:SpoVK/Ycf46/Vps4 family AAA+-type ATPase
MSKIDISGAIWAQFEQTRNQAQRLAEAGQTAEAAATYRRCAELLRQYADFAVSDDVKKQWLERATRFDETAARVLAGRSARPTTEPVADAEDTYRDAVRSLITKADVSWGDIGGLEETKREIQTAYALAVARKPSGVRLSGARNILLYGPPGTGKTLLAAATSHELDATFFNVKVSDMLSKYFGESSKLVSALFAEAAARAPSVIFLDEFDALSGSRDSSDSGAERRVLATLLAELDGLDDKRRGDERYVLSIAATNVPWQIDKAVLSRFGARLIYVPLPDEAARCAILEIHTTQRGHKTEIPLAALAQRTAGYSGREIEAVVGHATASMVRRANPGLLKEAAQGREVLAAYMLKVEAIQAADFETALAAIQPITRAADIARYDAWRRQAES